MLAQSYLAFKNSTQKELLDKFKDKKADAFPKIISSLILRQMIILIQAKDLDKIDDLEKLLKERLISDIQDSHLISISDLSNEELIIAMNVLGEINYPKIVAYLTEEQVCFLMSDVLENHVHPQRLLTLRKCLLSSTVVMDKEMLEHKNMIFNWALKDEHYAQFLIGNNNVKPLLEYRSIPFFGSNMLEKIYKIYPNLDPKNRTFSLKQVV